ncbi:hypothetical protein NQZ68_020112, partial [Dissostichus eleginoides]
LLRQRDAALCSGERLKYTTPAEREDVSINEKLAQANMFSIEASRHMDHKYGWQASGKPGKGPER